MIGDAFEAGFLRRVLELDAEAGGDARDLFA
jgi:hypothetical protein